MEIEPNIINRRKIRFKNFKQTFKSKKRAADIEPKKFIFIHNEIMV